MSSQDDENPLLEEVREVKKWARIQGLESLSQILQEFNEEELVMYDLADGERGMADIADNIHSGSSTVSKRMQDWNELGIVEKDGRQWKHIAPLSAMGIERPDLDLEDDES
jgi:hypothetical protein